MQVRRETMKRTLIAALLAATGTAFANSPFDFQRQIGSEEYVHGYDAGHIDFAPVTETGLVSSLERVMREANVDGIAPNDFDGEIVKTGPTRISLFEAYADSSEYAAYSNYHERLPMKDSRGREGVGNNVAGSADMRASDS
jgi:hypothetical protein